jgi:hypothetical protein
MSRSLEELRQSPFHQELGRKMCAAYIAQQQGIALEADAIDEFIIHTVPAMIGEGIPLLRMKPSSIALELIAARRFPDGVIRSHYRIAR